jgi:CheY-like chemotaxis protein
LGVVPAARPDVGKSRPGEHHVQKSGAAAWRHGEAGGSAVCRYGSKDRRKRGSHDDAAVRTTVAMQLKSLGYAVREADGAQAALQLIAGGEKIDLLFTDVVMPGGMNGKELAAAARRQRPDLPTLFTSGFPGTSQDGGVAFDADDVLLSKPYRKQELARAVRRMLATRR